MNYQKSSKIPMVKTQIITTQMEATTQKQLDALTTKRRTNDTKIK